MYIRMSPKIIKPAKTKQKKHQKTHRDILVSPMRAPSSPKSPLKIKTPE